MTHSNQDVKTLYIEYDYLDSGLTIELPPLTHDLIGQPIALHLDDGSTLFVHFKDETDVVWWTDNQPAETARYEALETRPGVYFVDWVLADDAKQSMSLVVDYVAQEATLLHTILPDGEDALPCLHRRVEKFHDLSAVQATIRHAGLGHTRQHKTHQPTTELVGKRVACHYGTHTYEHIYLNPDLFTWHCVWGEGKGSADTDPCHYFKLGDNLYLVIWREKIASALGVVVLDLTHQQSTGKLYSSKPLDPDRVINYLMRAEVKLLNETRYD